MRLVEILEVAGAIVVIDAETSMHVDAWGEETERSNNNECSAGHPARSNDSR